MKGDGFSRVSSLSKMLEPKEMVSFMKPAPVEVMIPDTLSEGTPSSDFSPHQTAIFRSRPILRLEFASVITSL